MIMAIVGSRNITKINLSDFLPGSITEIVSGAAKGIDSCAREYALLHNIPLKEYLPEYSKYGKRAPLVRNLQIIDYADEVIAFWDGKSHGTKNVIDMCKKRGKTVTVYYVNEA